jgi:prepilin-type processing-associated H-X9-DG protein
MVELLVIVATLVLLAACLLPALAMARAKAKRVHCASNLKQIGMFFRIWASDNHGQNPMQVAANNGGTVHWVSSGEVSPHFQILSNELNAPCLLVCPADDHRTMATSFDKLSKSNLSYFIGLDAEETQPQMFLSGDSNLEVGGKPVSPGLLNLRTNIAIGWTAARHVRQGNIALADGSVQQYSNAKLGQALVVTGVATNRLAIP